MTIPSGPGSEPRSLSTPAGLPQPSAADHRTDWVAAALRGRLRERPAMTSDGNGSLRQSSGRREAHRA
jgi:hypothetical protein